MPQECECHPDDAVADVWTLKDLAHPPHVVVRLQHLRFGQVGLGELVGESGSPRFVALPELDPAVTARRWG